MRAFYCPYFNHHDCLGYPRGERTLNAAGERVTHIIHNCWGALEQTEKVWDCTGKHLGGLNKVYCTLFDPRRHLKQGRAVAYNASYCKCFVNSVAMSCFTIPVQQYYAAVRRQHDCPSVCLWCSKQSLLWKDCVELVSLEPLTGLVMAVCVCVPQVIEGNNAERDEYCL